MCNPACIEFGAAHLPAADIAGRRVLEVGARDVNGSLRNIVERFEPQSYLGVDIEQGPGVDEICDIGELTNRYGTEAFDVVLATEVIEHVRDWRSGIRNLKRVLKPNGSLLLTTRSRGFHYHGYPFDFWRYEVRDMERIFADLAGLRVEPDPLSAGVFVSGRKPVEFQEENLDDVELYSIVRNKRCREIRDRDILLFKMKWRASRPIVRLLPASVKASIARKIWRPEIR